MRTSSIVWIIIILLIVGAGVWFFMSAPAVQNTNTNPTTTPSGQTPITTPPTSTSTSSGTPLSVTVHYSASGFSPKSVTVAKGGMVTWVNDGGTSMWVASANHPDHTKYDGSTLQQHCATTGSSGFDQCKVGSTYSFTFDKTGTWNYHNHSKAQDFGSVVVQ